MVGQKGGALRNGVSVFIKETPERDREKTALDEPGSRPSSLDPEFACAFTLDFPAFRTVRSKISVDEAIRL